MINRDFRIISDEQSLTVYINDVDMIYLEAGANNEDVYYRGFIELNKEDALELADELKKLADKL